MRPDQFQEESVDDPPAMHPHAVAVPNQQSHPSHPAVPNQQSYPSHPAVPNQQSYPSHPAVATQVSVASPQLAPAYFNSPGQQHHQLPFYAYQYQASPGSPQLSGPTFFPAQDARHLRSSNMRSSTVPRVTLPWERRERPGRPNAVEMALKNLFELGLIQQPSQPAVPQLFPGQGSGPQLFPGQGSGPQLFPGQGSGPQLFPGQGSGPQLFPGQGSGPQLFPGQAAGPQLFPGQAAGPQLFPGQAAGPQLFPGQAAGPQLLPGQATAPQMFQGPSGHVTASARNVAAPSSAVAAPSSADAAPAAPASAVTPVAAAGSGAATGPSSNECVVCRDSESEGFMICGHSICAGCFTQQLRIRAQCPDPRCLRELNSDSFILRR